MILNQFGSRRAVGLILSVAVLAGCDSEDPTAPLQATAPSFSHDEVSPFAKQVMVCKVGPAGTTATFDTGRSQAVGELTTPITLNSQPPGSGGDPTKCGVVWLASNVADPMMTVRITEQEQPGLELEKIVAFSDETGEWEDVLDPSGTSYEVDVDWSHGAIIFFHNMEVELPPVHEGEGCSARQWVYLLYWSLLTRDDDFRRTFWEVMSREPFNGKTLWRILWSSYETGVNGLGRETLAALFNAAHTGVDYPLDVAGVIEVFKTAHDSGEYETARDAFAELNRLGCPYF